MHVGLPVLCGFLSAPSFHYWLILIITDPIHLCSMHYLHSACLCATVIEPSMAALPQLKKALGVDDFSTPNPGGLASAAPPPLPPAADAPVAKAPLEFDDAVFLADEKTLEQFICSICQRVVVNAAFLDSCVHLFCEVYFYRSRHAV